MAPAYVYIIKDYLVMHQEKNHVLDVLKATMNRYNQAIERKGITWMSSRLQSQLPAYPK